MPVVTASNYEINLVTIGLNASYYLTVDKMSPVGLFRLFDDPEL